MKIRTTLTFFGVLVVSTLLAGCGGGTKPEDCRPSPLANAPGNILPPCVVGTSGTPGAEGAYQGTVSNGREHYTLVLENDQFYSMYGNTVNGVFLIAGLVQGQGSSRNGSFSAADVKDFLFDGSVLSATLSASYIAGSSFNGTISYTTSSNLSLTGTPLQSSMYDYNAAADLTRITGAWSMRDIQGDAITLNIASSGAFTASSGGCQFSGTMAPRASGRNVFDMALTFGSAPCRFAQQNATGIAIDYLLASGRTQLLIAGTNATRTGGTIAAGSR
jgi:hypothetical protein